MSKGSFTSETASASGKAGADKRWTGHVKLDPKVDPPEEPCTLEESIFAACHLLHAKKQAHRRWAAEIIHDTFEAILARNAALLRVAAKMDAEDT